MSKYNEKQRVLILFDMQNFYYFAKKLYDGSNVNVDYCKLLETALQGRTLVRAIGYPVGRGTQGEKKFFNFLKTQGIELNIQKLRTFCDGTSKADCDVSLVVDAMRLVREEKIDVVVLATGDGDFVPLVDELHKQGIIVEVISFRGNTAMILQEAADKFTDLGKHMDVLFFRSPRNCTC